MRYIAPGHKVGERGEKRGDEIEPTYMAHIHGTHMGEKATWMREGGIQQKLSTNASLHHIPHHMTRIVAKINSPGMRYQYQLIELITNRTQGSSLRTCRPKCQPDYWTTASTHKSSHPHLTGINQYSDMT